MKEIYQAISDCQKELTNPHKDQTAVIKGVSKSGSAYEKKYSYSDLSTILNHIRPVLAKFGLAIVQPMQVVDGKTYLVTKLIHSSGQSIDSVYELLPKASAQEFGSQMTYARRYAICALVGVAAEDDDDGEMASKKTDQTQIPDTGLEMLGKNVLPEGPLRGITVKDAWQYRKIDSMKYAQELKDILSTGKKIHQALASFVSYGEHKGLI